MKRRFYLAFFISFMPTLILAKNNQVFENELIGYFNEFFYKNNKINKIKLRPVPWLTEDAIKFLEEFFKLNKDPKVLEFGSGASTLWFAQRTKNLTSVEHNQDWFNFVKSTLESTPNTFSIDYHYIPQPYYQFCDNIPDNFFDLVLVDGRNRKGCILHAIRILKPGGILMLDNAERKYYQCIFSYLKEWKTIITEQTKPDLCGFWYKGWKTQWWVKPKNLRW